MPRKGYAVREWSNSGLERIGFQLVYEWQLAQGVAIGPWGLVTLALGTTPTLTAELELELELPVEDELLVLLDDELLLLDESEFDLPPDLAPAFELELAAA